MICSTALAVRHTKAVARTPRYYAPERLGALTDGVFAIALTLLVLELKLPDPPPETMSLAEIFQEDWHPFVGWVI
ncbi:MAG: Endosomal/lysosomal potassium channel, partial [Actinomycetota bacterium]